MVITPDSIKNNFIEPVTIPGMKKLITTLLEAELQRVWYGRQFSFWYLVLWPFSQLFAALSAIRGWAYRCGLLKTWRAPVPVIVIGNISVGGTGKTPLTLWLVEFLKLHGFHPGIVSRGYGGSATQAQSVHRHDDARVVGDEPLLLARRDYCPVWIGQKRSAAAQALLALHQECDVLICDDGLQHYALERDVEIVVIDGLRRYGNGMLLPAGPLRESPARLGAANAIVAHGGVVETGEFFMQLQPTVFRNLLDNSRILETDELCKPGVYAIAGIGNPQRFFDTLSGLGVVCETEIFPDHHEFKVEDFKLAGAHIVVMTEKDAVKCQAFAQANWWYLEVHADVDAALGERILNNLRKWNE